MNISVALNKFKASMNFGIDHNFWLRQLRDAYYEDFSKKHYRTKVVNWSLYAILGTWLIAAFVMALIFTVIPLGLPVLAALAAVVLVAAILTTAIMGKMRHNAHVNLKYSRNQVKGDPELLNQNSNEHKLAGIMNLLDAKESHTRLKIEKIFAGTVGQQETRYFKISSRDAKMQVYEEQKEKQIKLTPEQKEYLKYWCLTSSQFAKLAALKDFIDQYGEIVKQEKVLSDYIMSNAELCGKLYLDLSHRNTFKKAWKDHCEYRSSNSTAANIKRFSGFLADLTCNNWGASFDQEYKNLTQQCSELRLDGLVSHIKNYNNLVADLKFWDPLHNGIKNELHPLINVLSKRDVKIQEKFQQEDKEAADRQVRAWGREITDISRGLDETSMKRDRF